MKFNKTWTKRALIGGLLAFAGTFSACDKDDDQSNNGNNNNNDDNSGKTVTVKDDGSGTGTTTWTSDKTYILDGFVFVNEGQTLTIEPGTVIKGKPGTGSDASALIVARGGKIKAQGKPTNPIIFTAEADDVSDPTDIGPKTRGLWGGVIILGKAGLNSQPGETQVEGIPTSETRGLYGGNQDDHDAGVFKYVSIRHGGSNIGAGNEINGLTLAGVGTETEVHHVEVFANVDDGVEWFGGTAQTHHLVTALCGDDSYDYDEGFRGKGQFWFAIQDPDKGDRGGEHDGGTDPEEGKPYGTPEIRNATYIGGGLNKDRNVLLMRDNAGGQYWSSIFANWQNGVQIENASSASENSFDRFQAGDLALAENIFVDVVSSGTSASAGDIFKVSDPGVNGGQDQTDFENSFSAKNNKVADPGLSYTVSTSGGLDPIPSNAGVVNGAPSPNDPFFDAVNYRGAFDPSKSNTWMKGWTFLDEAGFLD